MHGLIQAEVKRLLTMLMYLVSYGEFFIVLIYNNDKSDVKFILNDMFV